jgi:predicted nucleic acid-binding protein
MSALFRASGAGSLDGVLRIASAFVDLGDDEIVTHALRIARRLAGSGTEPELHDLLAALETHVGSAAPVLVSRRTASRLH